MPPVLPLYDRLGTPAAFFFEDQERFLFSWGADAAWLRLGAVYTYTGAHVGWWLDDRMIDIYGGILLWVEGAPGLPHPQPHPFKQFTIPTPGPPPGRPFTQLPHDQPEPLAQWSKTVFGAW